MKRMKSIRKIHHTMVLKNKKQKTSAQVNGVRAQQQKHHFSLTLSDDAHLSPGAGISTETEKAKLVQLKFAKYFQSNK